MGAVFAAPAVLIALVLLGAIAAPLAVPDPPPAPRPVLVAPHVDEYAYMAESMRIEHVMSSIYAAAHRAPAPVVDVPRRWVVRVAA